MIAATAACSTAGARCSRAGHLHQAVGFRRWKTILLVVMVFVLAGLPAAAGPLPLPPEDQAEVNLAIKKGLQHLYNHPTPKGTWAPNESHAVGYAALPGLTLLECGVPINDRKVQLAAAYVRAHGMKLDRTYELSLSILFLDRLGDSRDKALIQAMAMRLVAGQTATGGWSYRCPILTPREHQDLYTLITKLNPPQQPSTLDPVVSTGRDPDPGSAHRSPGSTEEPLPGLHRDPTKPGDKPEISQGSYLEVPTFPRPGWCIKMTEEVRPRPAAQQPPPPPKPPQNIPIPPHLAGFPVLRDPRLLPVQDPPGDHGKPGVTDNSNTQFAILALWTARRYGVPMDRTMNLVVRRFRTSQNQDGRWGYRYGFGGNQTGTPAMTCVGLLGLAVGHGIAQDPDVKQRADDDAMIKKGFLALHRLIGTPANRMRGLPMDNLYFLWSVERVAVLYDLDKILDKDWYRWGAEILVANQAADGSWVSDKYPGRSSQIDTCLALLFLKRANLAKDLTKRVSDELKRELVTLSPGETASLPPATPEKPEVRTSTPGQFVGPPEPSPEERRLAAARQAQTTPVGSTAPTEEVTESKGRIGLWILGGGLLLLCVGFGIVALIVMSRGSDDDEGGRHRLRRHLPGKRRLKKAVRD